MKRLITARTPARFRSMNVSKVMHDARLDLPTLARLTSGRIRLPFLKQLSRGAKEANEEHRTVLADAYRRHAADLAALADQLDPA